MKKFTGPEFKLLLTVEAPTGRRKGTTIKLLKELLNKTICFTANSIEESEDSLNIIYHEPSSVNEALGKSITQLLK